MHILLVEDDAKVAEFIVSGFSREGHSIIHAKDGAEGLAGALTGGHDAAILDIMLPKISGLEVLQRIRAEGLNLPIIVLSARGSVESKVEGLSLGADDYLAKPFSFTELMARVQALVRRSESVPEAHSLTIGDLEMDIMSHRVTRAGRKIELQPLEYQLLEYLMRNRGRIISKSTIMERVWDYSFNPHTNVVECRVSRLRAKLTQAGEKELLHTVRGFGYVLEAR